jgi:hypothetical protein
MFDMRGSRAELFRIAAVIANRIEDFVRQDYPIVDAYDTFYYIEQSPWVQWRYLARALGSIIRYNNGEVWKSREHRGIYEGSSIGVVPHAHEAVLTVQSRHWLLRVLVSGSRGHAKSCGAPADIPPIRRRQPPASFHP